MKKLMIAVPCMDQLPAQFAHSLAALTSYGLEGYEMSVRFNLGSLIYTSRNEIAKRAVMDGADLVMWFDSDMVFNADTLRVLAKHIEAGADMVTGIYYRRTVPYSPVLFETMEIDEAKQEAHFTEFDKLPDEPFEVAACGFGCVLMRSDIFLSVYTKFNNMFSPIGNVGEDISFCWRARQCGYKILADPAVSLGHVGHVIVTKEFYENYRGLQV